MQSTSLAALLSDEVVFQRTATGQGEGIYPRILLSESLERRLLLAVSGFTTLGVPIDLYPAHLDVVAALRRPLELKPIEPFEVGE